MATDKTYKQRHEDFVSGLSGGNVLEIYLVTLIGASAYIAWSCVQSRLGWFSKGGKLALTVDFLLNWVGPLLSMTLYSSMPLALNLLVVAPAVLVALTSTKPAKQHAKGQSQSSGDLMKQYLPKRAFLTVYRGSMMVLTCIAILAVDFKEFPRRFAKVETWGTSLMDLGVGSFVFSMGLVSARGALVDAFHNKKTPFFKAMAASFRQAATVLALGVIRLLCVKYFDYQEHVTEYGVHWNFFMTLGCLPPFVTLLWFIPKRAPLAIVALVIAASYEAALDMTDLGAYVLSAPRVAVISSNKEGIFSFFGYLAIFLAGKSTGYYALPASTTSYLRPQTREQFNKSPKGKKRWNATIALLVSSFIHNVLLQISLQYLTPSRRLANLPYVLWMVSYNTAFVALLSAVENLFFSETTQYKDTIPQSLDAVNYNGLLIFIVGNVSTGVINMNVQTLDASRLTTMAVLALHCLALFTISMVFYRYGIQVKI